MANTINADSGAISGVPGVKTTADTSGVLALQADGTTIATISTTGLAVAGTVSFPAGSAAAPSIAPTGDSNTGMFFPAADTIAFSEGGTETVRLTSSGNLQFSATGQRITGDFSNATAANRLLFQTSTTNGNSFVGAMPNGTGTYGAYIAYNGSDPANSSSLLQGITSTDARLVSTFAGTGSYLPMTFYTGGSERVRIDTSGNVGIGTASPGAKLDVQGGRSYFAANSDAFATYLRYNSSTAGVFLGSPSADAFQISKSSGAAYLNIDSSGNVGIGTASPTAKLDAATSINLGLNYLNVGYDAGGGAGWVSGYNTTYSSGVKNTVTGALSGVFYSSDSIRFHTNASAAAGTAAPERMRIGSAGQLGIGGANYGTSGQVLTSNGAAAAPSWQTPGGLPTVNVVTGTTQAAVSGNQYVLTNVAATTVTLPAAPSAGAVVWITVANGLATNVVARNGSNIQSLAEDLTLNSRYAAVQLRYADATRGWVFT